MAGFVPWYNDEHRHSGIRFVTPGERHRGEDAAVLEQRKAVYAAARKVHPERWSGDIRNWDRPETVSLNPNKSDHQKTQESTQKQNKKCDILLDNDRYTTADKMTRVTQSTGYCYVVEFSNGRIKVGTTKHLSTRLKTHKSLALSNGVVAIRFAHTKRHSNYLDNEKALINKLAKAGNVAHGREFFEYVEFDYAAQCLRELTYEGIEPDEHKSIEPVEIEHTATVISTKHDIPVYCNNPSISEYQKGLKSNVENPGDVYEWEEVDKERFVKLFLAGVKQASGLSKAGLAIFEVVYNLIRENPNSDKVELNFYHASEQIEGINERTYRRGLRELLDKGFLFRSPSEGVFFVNIRYMFNGDRLAFVKAYHLRGGNGKQRKLPAAG